MAHIAKHKFVSVDIADLIGGRAARREVTTGAEASNAPGI